MQLTILLNLYFISDKLLIPMEFVIYLQSITNSDGTYNWFTITYQSRWNLSFIYNHSSIPMEFVICLHGIPMEFIIDLHSLINPDGICSLFAINNQFRWNV